MTTDTHTIPAPPRTATNTPYWQGLKEGVLRFQRCRHCGHAWLPARSECPSCLGDQWTWEAAGGGARLISWVVYHVAYDKAFEQRLPYNVAIVELDEGPRLMSNVVGIADNQGLHIEQKLRLRIENEGGTAVPRFTPV